METFLQLIYSPKKKKHVRRVLGLRKRLSFLLLSSFIKFYLGKQTFSIVDQQSQLKTLAAAAPCKVIGSRQSGQRY